MCVLWLDNLKEKLSLSIILTEVKGQTSVIVQSDPSNSIKGSLLLGRRCGGIAVVMGLQIPILLPLTSRVSAGGFSCRRRR